MLVVVAISFIVSVAAAAAENHHKLQLDANRIVGGQEAKITDRPYQAYVHTQNQTSAAQCGGSIISSRYVLTAAHCFVNNTKDVFIRVGSIHRKKDGTPLRAKRFVIHESYDSAFKGYDIAYIDLGEKQIPLNGKTIKAIRLPSQGFEMPDKTKLVVSGWGKLQPGGNSSDVLMELNVEYMSRSECNRKIGSITKGKVCAMSNLPGKGSCQGDSGGPLSLARYPLLVGIVSYGYVCASGTPDVYTNVAFYRSWIFKNTGV